MVNLLSFRLLRTRKPPRRFKYEPGDEGEGADLLWLSIGKVAYEPFEILLATGPKVVGSGLLGSFYCKGGVRLRRLT